MENENMTLKEFNCVTDAKYVYVDGKLREIKSLATLVVASVDESRVTSLTVKYLIQFADYSVTMDESAKFYASKRAFEADESIKRYETLNKIADRFVNDYYYDGYKATKFGDGVHVFDMQKHTLTYKDNVYDKRNTYEDTKSCYDINSYIVVNADGTETISKPRLSRIMLTDEQRKALDDVKEAMMKAKELGVMFYYDMEDYDMYAFNGSEVSDYNWDGRSGHEDDDYTLADLDLVCYKGFPRVTDLNCETNIVME